MVSKFLAHTAYRGGHSHGVHFVRANVADFLGKRDSYWLFTPEGQRILVWYGNYLICRDGIVQVSLGQPRNELAIEHGLFRCCKASALPKNLPLRHTRQSLQEEALKWRKQHPHTSLPATIWIDKRMDLNTPKGHGTAILYMTSLTDAELKKLLKKPKTHFASDRGKGYSYHVSLNKGDYLMTENHSLWRMNDKNVLTLRTTTP